MRTKTKLPSSRPRRARNDLWRSVMYLEDQKEFPSPGDLIKGSSIDQICFGKDEIEESARNLVTFLAVTGNTWRAFTLEELVEHSEGKHISAGNALFGLIGAWFDDGMFGGPCAGATPPFIIQIDQSRFAVTRAFIRKLLEHK